MNQQSDPVIKILYLLLAIVSAIGIIYIMSYN